MRTKYLILLILLSCNTEMPIRKEPLYDDYCHSCFRGIDFNMTQLGVKVCDECLRCYGDCLESEIGGCSLVVDTVNAEWELDRTYSYYNKPRWTLNQHKLDSIREVKTKQYAH